MVGAELHFKAICSFAQWRCHYTSIGDDDIKAPAVVDKNIGRVADACKRCKVQLNQIKATAIDSRFANACCCGLTLRKVARSADDICSMRDKGAGDFYAETSRNTGNERSLAG